MSNTKKHIIVNENDEQIGVKTRAEIGPDDIYRVSGLWLNNSKGEILLAQRAFTKSNNPGIWNVAAAGTVDEGETYDDNIYKEAEEELGITGVTFKKLYKTRVNSEVNASTGRASYNYFVQIYFAVLDWPIEKFTLQKEEVEAIKWISEGDLRNVMKEHPGQYSARLLLYMDEINAAKKK